MKNIKILVSVCTSLLKILFSSLWILSYPFFWFCSQSVVLIIIPIQLQTFFFNWFLLNANLHLIFSATHWQFFDRQLSMSPSQISPKIAGGRKLDYLTEVVEWHSVKLANSFCYIYYGLYILVLTVFPTFSQNSLVSLYWTQASFFLVYYSKSASWQSFHAHITGSILFYTNCRLFRQNIKQRRQKYRAMSKLCNITNSFF